jgi:cysteinyl-tRNA synthetase
LFGEEYGKQLGWTGEKILINSCVERFNEAVDDDFNFAGGLVILFELAKELGTEKNNLTHEGKTRGQDLEAKWQTLVELSQVLGLEAEWEAIADGADGMTDTAIEASIQQRAEARKNKNFAEGDRIRDELKSQGIILIDQPGGLTKWYRE